MSSKAEQQDLAFQGLREKIPWYISARNAVLRNPNMLIGIVFISLVVILALLCPLLIKMGILRDPFVFDPLNRLLPPGRSEEGDLFLFGTGPLGRDIFSMVIYGSRISLVVGVFAFEQRNYLFSEKLHERKLDATTLSLSRI